MSLLERIYFFHSRLQSNRYPNASDLAEEFEVSSATAHRDINYLRDRLLAPLVFNQQKNGYYYTDSSFRLPFEESSKVVLFLGILTTIAGETGLAGLPELKQLQDKLTSLAVPGGQNLAKYLHCEWVETEPLDEKIFTNITSGLLSGKQLALTYKTTESQHQQRNIDPLKLLHYQGRWYVYGWCHLRQARRLFHLARILTAKVLATPVIHSMEMDDSSLTGVFGIFKGNPKYKVTVKLKGFAADIVCKQTWHPQQSIEEVTDGILLTLPVADDREILMKVLQFGGMAEIITPASLRKKIAEEVKKTAQLYNE